MLITAALTVVLLPLVSVMAWRCWRLQPVPAIRIWSLSFAAMTLAMVLQAWRAELWRSRFAQLTIQLQSEPLRYQQYRQSLPKIMFFYQLQWFRHAEFYLSDRAPQPFGRPLASPSDLARERQADGQRDLETFLETPQVLRLCIRNSGHDWGVSSLDQISALSPNFYSQMNPKHPT